MRLKLCVLAVCVCVAGSGGKASGQLIVNEFNVVGATRFIETDATKPYEGFDYGALEYSGNDDAPPMGNPFPADVHGGIVGNQTTMPNGWDGTDPDNATGWARIQGNGGDWIELVVTEDHLDVRGWSIYWENDETDLKGDPATRPPGNTDPGDFIIGSHPNERGFVQLSQDALWSDLRAGTIITISEDASVHEIRDQYIPGQTFPGPPNNDTGFDYSLATDTSFDPASGDWHMHFHLNESITQDMGLPTQYFGANSNIKADNDDMRMAIFNATNTSIAQWAWRVLPGDTDADSDVDLDDFDTVAANFNQSVTNDELDGDFDGNGVVDMDDFVQLALYFGKPGLDLTTGIVGEFIGESASGWGNNTGAGGLNNAELGVFLGSPGLGGTSQNEDYEDVDFSTFGMPNMFNTLSEAGLDGVQDFSALRAWFSPPAESVATLPEPASAGVLMLGVGLLAWRRRSC